MLRAVLIVAYFGFAVYRLTTFTANDRAEKPVEYFCNVAALVLVGLLLIIMAAGE